MKIPDRPAERVMLHVRCIQQRPAHWRFHFAGIVREIPAADRLLVLLSALAAALFQYLAITHK